MPWAAEPWAAAMRQERIVFVVDLDDELNNPGTNKLLGRASTSLATIKECLQNFAYLKSWMRPAASGSPHEFGLLGLTSTICWQVPFTSSAVAFAETVGSLCTWWGAPYQ